MPLKPFGCTSFMDTASAGVATLNTLSENTALSPILSVRFSNLQLQISFYISIMFMYLIIINIYLPQSNVFLHARYRRHVSPGDQNIWDHIENVVAEAVGDHADVNHVVQLAQHRHRLRGAELSVDVAARADLHVQQVLKDLHHLGSVLCHPKRRGSHEGLGATGHYIFCLKSELKVRILRLKSEYWD